jgi:signal transduction histidine kinase
MTPLTAVKTELEYILKKERSDDEYREALNKLLIQTDQMIKIVRTLLMISKQDNNNNKSQSVFNFSNLIQKIIVTEFAQDNIQSSIEKELYVRGDTDKFHIVLENLIDNAIKYSDNDKIVNVSLTKNDTFANLIIKDSGIGISDFDKEKVFDRFYRSEKAEKLGIKGYGLGLSLVKLLIEEAGGNISVKDNEPGGTIFIVTLPYLALT